jgi:hypothetical protein
MAKKRIQNYVFLPGTASSSNAYPNAYTLLVNNKSFIQKEANTYISNSIATDTAINLNPNAIGLLTNNKEFLKKEIRAYIAARVAASNGPFAGYTYDADKCERDVGYVIDAYIYDLRYGGNEQIRYVAEQYWLGGTPQVDGTRQAEIWAHTKLRDIITKYVFTRSLYPTEQVAGVVQSTVGSDAETHMQQRLSSLSEVLLDVITNGLSVLETTNLYPNAASLLTRNKEFLKDEITAWIATQVAGNIAPFVGFTYDASKCKRDVGYVIEAYISDLKNGGTEKTREAAQQYWLGGVAQVDGSRAAEVAAHTKLRDIIDDFILAKLPYTSAQNPVVTTQDVSGSTAEAGTTTIIATLASVVINTINSGLIALTNLNLYPNAATLLTNNKEFLKDEITAWIATQVAGNIAPFVGYTYDAVKCKRDVGYIIDGYIYDIRYGGKEGTRDSISQYWVGTTAQVDGNRLPEVAAHTKLRDIINNNILPKVAYSSVQSPVTSTQNLSGSAAESGVTAIITSLASVVTSVITNGLNSLPLVPITQSLRNFSGYVYDTSKCERDIGYVLDAYANDLRFGGNIETRFVASRYWESGVPQVDGDRRPEIKTHEFIRDLINSYIFPQIAYTPLQVIVSRYTNNGITYETAASSRIYNLENILTTVIENGLSSIPARSNGVTQIKVQGKINLEEILLITNTTNNEILYNFSSADYGAVVDYFDTYNSNGFSRDDDYPAFLQTADYVTTITLDIDTSTCSSSDDIQIFVEKNEMTIRPWDFGTDAIERMRVATPQSMLDADFEYGLQPTKWQAIGLLRQYPSVYEIPGTDTAVSTVVTDASVGTGNVGASLITVTTAGPHGFTVGTPITIKALANTITGFSRAEGTFLVNTVPTSSTFTYYSASKVGTSNGQVLATAYTQLRKASFYTGASLGTPSFSIYSPGSAGTITSEFITTSGSDQIAFIGTPPSIGAPLTASGINPGTQVTGVVGSGGVAVQTGAASSAIIGDTTIEVENASGILEGMGIDNGTGTAIFVTGISGTTVSLSAPLAAPKIGSSEVYTGLSATLTNPIGSGATFNFARVNGSYQYVGVANGGSNYLVGDRVRILGSLLGGSDTTNDITITILSVDSGGSVANVDSSIPIAFSGTSVNGSITYSPVSQSTTTGSGINSTWNVVRSDTGDSSAGLYSVTNINPGSNFNPGDQIVITGDLLGGSTPENDLFINVQTVGGLGEILTYGTLGSALGTDTVFTNLSCSNLSHSGVGAVFTVSRFAGAYTATITSGGSNYKVGNVLTITGSSVGGTIPTNNLTMTVTQIDGGTGAIQLVLESGNAISGSVLDFISAISLSEVTIGTIADATSIAYAAIAGIQVDFTTAHGLVPGASITTSINSNGTNHGYAAGPFFVESVPTPTRIRYTARTSGTIDTSTISLTGTVYTRSDAYFIHRPYDGGVQLGTGGPQHGAQAIRMSKKYIRYQSGKGVMYTTGALFAPSYDLQSLTATGTSIGSYITVVTDDVDHGCQIGGVIKIKGVVTSGYNGEYTVTDIINERQFRIQAQTVLGNVYATLSGQAQMSLVRWHGATVRAGTFDEQNGIFWQYDGQTLSVGRRTSTFQLAGTVSITRDTNLITGTNTRFRDQLSAGDKIVIKGMTHCVASIDSQTSMTVTPDYRGAVDAVNSKLCKVEDIIIPQDQFNLDRLDGNGPSGYNVDTSTMQMIGIQYTWYGAGFIDFMLRGSDGNYVFVHRIRNSNTNTEAYMRTGNLPVRYEVINEGARDKLASSITSSQTTIPLTDATNFPNESGVVLIDNELVAFTGKSGNTLTGCTRAAPMTNFVAGASRTFTAGSANSHEYNTGVVLVSNTVSPIISHWGSAFLTDGRFDEDRGYLFNYAATNVSISTTKRTAFLIRLAPSVSNAIVGDLGERELLNRAQLLLKGIEITADSGTGGIVVEGVLNPQNYPVSPSDISWSGLQGSAQGGQPSFSQIAPGGSVVWSSAGSTSATATTLTFPTGSITARALSWRSNRSLQNNENYFAITESDRNTYISQGLAVGDRISGTGIPANATITQISFWYNDGVLGPLWFVAMNQNANQNVAGNSTLTVTKAYNTTNTSVLFFQSASWVSSGATTGTEVDDNTKYPGGTFVSSANVQNYFGTSYYRVTFNQSSIGSAFVPGTTTLQFKFGIPPYAQPGETVFSFVAGPGTTSVLDLSELKELTNTTLGGRGTYPNGPDVLAINVYKVTGAAINSNIVLRWGEAQA